MSMSVGGELTEEEKLFSLDHMVYVKGIWFNGREEGVKEFFCQEWVCG